MASAFRDFEHDGWTDPAVCASYDDLLSSLTTQSIAPMLDAAGVKAGSLVLDVATGAGYAAGAALARGAVVTGTDFSAEQVRLARQRFPAATLVEGDAASLPFASAAFDAVVANYGVLHFPEPEAFLREAFRVLKHGGRLAFTVWGRPDEARLFGAVLSAIDAHGDLDVGLPGGPDMFLFADAASSLQAMARAGFQDIAVTRVPQTWRPSSGEQILLTVKTGTVRMRGALQRQQAEVRDAIDDAILAALEPFRKGLGYEVPMPAVLTAATRP
ncbi:class I SAM-dependent methyltransferase [Variovorax saccharolyticus]|uniref:class I SAM-dependent methyltransferase n=1 Tax=Variovorax saccharolyticus TaxID=3053516 RepID=UPI002577A7DA|nr:MULTISPECIES: class I SAM-dependent methyltransferase [unclassified Variovorax]MDM0021680.1 class I SAM-dependent methyltransferase [Variovorax sp. J22R187]MDM0028065.1 class I SAM-dependent methyltransferase [Variovorax sp. J31P216]